MLANTVRQPRGAVLGRLPDNTAGQRSHTVVQLRHTVVPIQPLLLSGSNGDGIAIRSGGYALADSGDGP
jgi:hypothetical protein